MQLLKFSHLIPVDIRKGDHHITCMSTPLLHWTHMTKSTLFSCEVPHWCWTHFLHHGSMWPYIKSLIGYNYSFYIFYFGAIVEGCFLCKFLEPILKVGCKFWDLSSHLSNFERILGSKKGYGYRTCFVQNLGLAYARLAWSTHPSKTS